MKNILKNCDILKIEEAVKKAESTTSGEIVPAVLNTSDHYPASHFRSAIFFSLLITWIVYLLDFQIMDDTIYYLWLQLPSLLLGYYLVNINFIKRLFSMKAEFDEETHQKAVEIFLENNLHSTRDRTGILIYISILERKVEIIADEGINKKVDKDQWDKLVKNIILSIKKDQFVDGLCSAILECGTLLTEYFPIKDDDQNELSNKVITD